MKLSPILVAAALALSAPVGSAEARLQLSIAVGGSTFSCFDGQLSCDQSGGANNLLTIDQTVGGAFVQITLAQSTFGKANELQLSSSSILNQSGVPITVKLLASDTAFVAPVHFINNSGSLTFNADVGAGDSTLQFWADPTNTQGANPTNTPGALLETVSGHAVTDPDSFSGSKLAAFDAGAPFSMTEGASLVLRSGGSITGFNEAMESGVPEPSTWAMLLAGFGLVGLVGFRKRRRLAELA
jgi:PEP-CTERM motif